MLLTLAIFTPLVAAAVALFVPGCHKNGVRAVCLGGSLVTLALTIGLAVGYQDRVHQSTDPKDASSTNLVAVFGRKVEAMVRHAVPASTSREKIRDSELVIWLDAGAAFESQDRARFENAGIDRETWSRLLLRQKIARALADRTPYSEFRADPIAAPLVAALGQEEREAFGGEYDRVLELAIAQSNKGARHFRFVEYVPWIRSFRINYFVGADGLSIPLIFLTAFITTLSLVYSWYVNKAAKAFYILFLIMETGLIGVFSALDFFLFYVFWEVVLLPMYFIIGVWGGPRRIYAAIKFFIYTLVGSVLMLVAMLVLYNQTEPFSFNMVTLLETAPKLAFEVQRWLFLALFIGFAIKVPVFPFHTWLPDAHVEAPTAGSMILAAILLKMGGYGFFRVAYPMLPDAAGWDFYIFMVGGLGMINIVYGALAAMAQKDFKSLVAYSSISHMGFILLGLAAGTPGGYMGGVMTMFNHGISSAMMFCMVGCLQNRVNHRNLDDMGGFGTQMPYFFGLATVGFFAALGLPGLNGFIGEALTFLGCFDSHSQYHHTATILGVAINLRLLVYISLAGVVLTAGYVLWTVQRVFLGVTPEKYKGHADVNPREAISLIPLAAMCILIGVFPAILIDFMDPTVNTILDIVRTPTGGGLAISGR